MLPRVTTTTALPTVRQLAGDLARWVKEAGHLPSAQRLKDDLEQLQSRCGERVIEADLAFGCQPESFQDGHLPSWLGGAANIEQIIHAFQSGEPFAIPGAPGKYSLRIHAWPAATPPVYRVGYSRPPILIALADETTIEKTEVIESIERAIEDRPFTLIVTPRRTDWLNQKLYAWRRLGWQVEAIDLTATPTPTLPERLEAPPWEAALDLAQAHSIASAVDSLASVFAQALDQEIRAVKVKRAMAQQQSMRSQQPASVNYSTELLNDLRQRLKSPFTEFERGVNDRLQNLIGPQIGSLWPEVESRLNSLGELEQERRARSMVTRLPAAFAEGLINDLHQKFSRHFLGDLVAMRDLFNFMQRDIDESSTKAGGPPIIINFQYLTDQSYQRLLQMNLAVQRPYQGEAPRQGFFEYAMVARRYLMIGFMALSIFGLSFLRSVREFMVPVSILLVSLGALSVYNSVRKERVESKKRELEKAREAMMNEIKRIFTDIQRGWPNILNQHLNDQQSSAILQIEAALREHQGKKALETAEEKQKIQRQLQGLETAERKLQAPAKGRDVVTNALAQLRGEFRQLFVSALRQPPQS